MRYGSVCSGIEAATVAWHPLGWQPQFFSEIEAAPRAVLSHHYPGVPLHGDFTTIREGEYGAIDLLVGGTPCQSFSVAGLRGGLADDRGNLALQYLRLAERLRPRWLVWENVPGVLSSNGGRDFGAILGGMVELGYGFAYRVLDAQFVRVDGFGRAVPQRRRRVFVVGYLGDWRRPAAVLLERASLRGDPAPRREAGSGAAVGALAGTSPGGGWRVGADEAAAGQLVAQTLLSGGHANNPLDETLIAGALTSGDRGISPDQAAAAMIIPILEVGKGSTSRGQGPNGSGLGAAGDPMFTLQAGAQHAIAFDTTQITSAANRCNPKSGDPCHPLAAAGHPPTIAFDCKAGGDTSFAIGEIPGSLRGEGHGGGHAAIQQGWAVRRLTPRECERLQGFPDDYTAIPWRGGILADGPRYKALGNSMAVNAMQWIGRRIEAVEAIPSTVARAA
ncbi:DNA cytosine methyltransferase [Methylobacterium sp. C25]|nr:DNA cytosine methyltransferase [Methylobacterium sp. C25]